MCFYFLNMAKVEYAAFLALITLALGFSHTAAYIPFLSPALGNEACKTDVCGQGKCVASSVTAFGFECECDKGWKQSDSADNQFYKFLPCIVPDCTIDYSCAKAPDFAPNPKRSNFAVFDSCFWTDCGGGSCSKTSTFTHTCVCEDGYFNLLNAPSFPCYKECSLGDNCMSLINSSNPNPNPNPNPSPSPNPNPNPSPSGSTGSSGSHASSLMISVEFCWLIAMVATLAPFVWK